MRRVEKTVNGSVTQFLYDGLNPVQELDGNNPPDVVANLLQDILKNPSGDASRISQLQDIEHRGDEMTHTIIRMLNPFNASASIMGIFHPGYDDTHQQAAALLGMPKPEPNAVALSPASPTIPKKPRFSGPSGAIR